MVDQKPGAAQKRIEISNRYNFQDRFEYFRMWCNYKIFLPLRLIIKAIFMPNLYYFHSMAKSLKDAKKLFNVLGLERSTDTMVLEGLFLLGMFS